jgi:hypothetical protein
MRLSLWQQFSSNHSASFSIVGTFESPEKAEQAAAELREILRKVAGYWSQMSKAEQESKWANEVIEITPIEIELSKQYEIEWSKDVHNGKLAGLDWFPLHPEQAAEVVKVFEQHVGLENIASTWVSSKPFDDLLRKFGAKVVGSWEWHDYEDAWIDLTCDAPDEIIAQQMIDEARNGVFSHFEYLYFDEGSVLKREGRHIYYSVKLLYHIFDVLVGFLQYLRRHGCTNIQYTFRQWDT